MRIVTVFFIGVLLGLATSLAWADNSGDATPSDPANPANPGGFIEDSPFIPIPEVGTDPNTGTIVGLLPVYLVTDEHKQISRIYAPDIAHDPNFGWMADARVFDYPSEDTAWFVVGGMKQRVERQFNADYATGLLRQSDWSFHGSLIYDRNGTQRFYGLGNHSMTDGQTNFTREQTLAEAEVGYNFTPHIQVSFLARQRSVDVEQGTLSTLPSIETRYPAINGLGHASEFFNRVALTYDTRDSTALPTKGMQAVVYAGVTPNIGISTASYAVMGGDVRGYWSLDADTTLAGHAGLRIMPDADNAPFWALSSLGGDRAVIGGAQVLRGFGEGRFVDTNSMGVDLELRRRVLSLDLFSTQVDLQLAPFIDTGQVFHSRYGAALSQQHVVTGVGFRGLASPFIVGYVDVGYGTEGTAIYSGLGYAF